MGQTIEDMHKENELKDIRTSVSTDIKGFSFEQTIKDGKRKAH